MLKRWKRTILSGILCASIALSFSGCGEKEEGYLDANGRIPSYTMDEAPDGIYILKKEDKRVYKGLTVGGVNVEDDTFSTIHYWLLEDMEKAVPELTADDQIIIKSVSNRPDSYTFVKLLDYGYTVGTNFDVLEETQDIKSPTIITFGSDVNVNSPIKAYLDGNIQTGHESNPNVKLTAINGKEFLRSMLTEKGYLKGLTKQGMYNFTYYEGTMYKDIMIKADSHLFVASDVYKSSSYAEMEDKYFVIAPSSEMDNGYYYLKGYGMFYYSGAARKIGNDSDKEIDTDTSQSEDEKTTETSPLSFESSETEVTA